MIAARRFPVANSAEDELNNDMIWAVPVSSALGGSSS
jgi:hypothetical protein